MGLDLYVALYSNIFLHLNSIPNLIQHVEAISKVIHKCGPGPDLHPVAKSL